MAMIFSIAKFLGLLICFFVLTKIIFSFNQPKSVLVESPPLYFASRFPNYPNSYVPLNDIDLFFSYLHQPNLLCTDLRKIGGKLEKQIDKMDGQKAVCYDPYFGVNKGGDCTVLSFGINNDWSFDDAMGQTGCQVYAFDPTMAAGDHRRSDNVTFLHLGIGDFNGILKKKLKVETYSTILERLNLTISTIAYLKIDVEGYELDFFSDVFKSTPYLLKNVQQIGMEIHPGIYKGTGENPEGKFKTFWQYFQDLENFGFQVVSTNMNEAPVTHYKYRNKLRSLCYEVLWVQRKLIANQFEKTK